MQIKDILYSISPETVKLKHKLKGKVFIEVIDQVSSFFFFFLPQASIQSAFFTFHYKPPNSDQEEEEKEDEFIWKIKGEVLRSFFVVHIFFFAPVAPETETNLTLMTNTNEFWLILITKFICEGSAQQTGMGGGWLEKH